VFDLASVSKPFLAVLVTRLARRGSMGFDTPLGALLAEARGTPVEHAPIEALLAHRAGLEAHLPLFAPLESRRAVRFSAALVRSARSLRADCRNTAQALGYPFQYCAPLYSDLGYLLVGAALERVTGLRLDQLFEQELFAPLALDVGSARQWLERGDFLQRVAPTEILPWRGRPVRGRVHDDNCWALRGHGCAGHAGLFAPVAALLKFGCTLVDAFTGRDESYLDRAELERLTHPRPGGTLRCGFDGKALQGSSVGTSAGPRTFGHLGFTGTSLWCDPDAGIVMAMLTNRVHPTRENPRIRLARPLVHEALFRLAQSTDGLN
jgi:CubicO group peptidase (beta-lactamase class C family)